MPFTLQSLATSSLPFNPNPVDKNGNDDKESLDGPLGEPKDHDVICGRGGLSNNHPGNLWYRKLINCNREMYKKAGKYRKIMLSKAVVAVVQNRNPRGRFVERKSDGNWYAVDDQRAIAKTSQALREQNNSILEDTKVDGEQLRQLVSQQLKPWLDEAMYDLIKKRTLENNLGKLKGGAKRGRKARGVPQKMLQGISKPQEVPVLPPHNQHLAHQHQQYPGPLSVTIPIPPMLVPPMRPGVHPSVPLPPPAGFSRPLQHVGPPPMYSPTTALSQPPAGTNAGLPSLKPPAVTNMITGFPSVVPPTAERALREPMVTSPKKQGLNKQPGLEQKRPRLACTLPQKKNTAPAEMDKNEDHSSTLPSFRKERHLERQPVLDENQFLSVSATRLSRKKNKTLPEVAVPENLLDSQSVDKNAPVILKKGLEMNQDDTEGSNDKLQEGLRKNDVVCGAGGLSNNHPGNLWYRKLINCHREIYKKAGKFHKSMLSKAVVAVVAHRDPPVRFMERNSDGEWVAVDVQRAIAKTTQALREQNNTTCVDTEADGEQLRQLVSQQLARMQSEAVMDRNKRKDRRCVSPQQAAVPPNTDDESSKKQQQNGQVGREQKPSPPTAGLPQMTVHMPPMLVPPLQPVAQVSTTEITRRPPDRVRCPPMHSGVPEPGKRKIQKRTASNNKNKTPVSVSRPNKNLRRNRARQGHRNDPCIRRTSHHLERDDFPFDFYNGGALYIPRRAPPEEVSSAAAAVPEEVPSVASIPDASHVASVETNVQWKFPDSIPSENVEESENTQDCGDDRSHATYSYASNNLGRFDGPYQSSVATDEDDSSIDSSEDIHSSDSSELLVESNKSSKRKRQVEESQQEAMDAVNHASKRPKISRSHKQVDMWDQRLEELKKFKSEHGHCRVTTSSGPLYDWLRNQSQRYLNPKHARCLKHTDERERRTKKLESVLGKDLDTNMPRNDKWNQRLEELRKFKSEHGHCRVSTSSGPLYKWLRHQSQRYLNPKHARCIHDVVERERRTKKLESVLGTDIETWRCVHNGMDV